MAQSKFKLNSKEEDGLTHAHTQTIEPKVTPSQKLKSKPLKRDENSNGILSCFAALNAGAGLAVHMIKLFEILTPAQKNALVEYAKADDKTASCVIKELLLKEGIIEE